MQRFVFRNYNGILQLRLETLEDLELIHSLEEAAWQATSAPIEQLFCDPKMLTFLDFDANARVRVNEIRTAHDWLKRQLRNLSGVENKSDSLELSHLDSSSPEAALMKALAERMIRERAGGPNDSVSLAEVRRFRDSYAAQFPNGDGVVTEAQIADHELRELGVLVLAATGGADDLSGKKGIRRADVDAFLELARQQLAWEAEPAAEGASLLPFGGETKAIAELTRELDPKMDQFFNQCDLIAVETGVQARAAAPSNDQQAVTTDDPNAARAYVLAAPLARPNAEGVLDLNGVLNPAFAEQLRALASEVLPAIPDLLSSGRYGPPGSPRKDTMGGKKPRISRSDWQAIFSVLRPHLEWQARRPKPLPGELGGDKLKSLVEGPLPDRLRALVLEDERASDELRELNSLEKLILYQRWFFDVVNNFVSFPYLFTAGARSLFEMGTLILDGRVFSLCVLVVDRAAHKKVAESSRMFVVYAELTRKDGDKTVVREIASAVTAGTRGGVEIGKRGVFYDRDEQEWDARVVDVLVAPISMLEAAIAPFVRLKTFIATRIEKLTSSHLEEMEKSAAASAATHLDTAATAAPAAPKAKVEASPVAAPASGFTNLLLGGGVAFAAVGSTLAFVVKTLSDINLLNAGLAVLWIALAITIISCALGWAKLRRRNLAALLEGCGWALNRRMFLTRRLSRLFTWRPKVPKGSSVERVSTRRASDRSRSRGQHLDPRKA